MTRFFKLLPGEQGQAFLGGLSMSSISQELPRLRLDTVTYESLGQQVLHRDSWRFQSCGTMSNLEVHYKQFRSHSGHDSEEKPDHILRWLPQIDASTNHFGKCQLIDLKVDQIILEDFWWSCGISDFQRDE